MKEIILWLLALGYLCPYANAQSAESYSTYQRTQDYINPAYTGSQGPFDLSLDYKKEWMEFQGAPTTLMLSTSGLVGEKVGLGLNIESRNVNVERRLKVFSNYAYKLPLSTGVLQLGIKAGVMNFSGNYTDVETNVAGDLAFSENVNRWQANFGMGAFYHSQNWYAGISVPMLLQDNLDDEESTLQSLGLSQRNYFLSAGCRLQLNDLLSMQPNALLSFSEEDGVNGIFGVNLYYLSSLWTGLNWISNNMLNANLHYQLNDRISAGYAYETGIGQINNSATSAHLLNVRYNIKSLAKASYSTPY